MLSFWNQFFKKNTMRSDIARSYERRPTFIDRLPWRDYHTKHKCFLLEDNEGLGVGFSITPIACEARPAKMMEEISKSISEAIKNTIPLEKDNPWILQIYVKKESNLSKFYQEVEAYYPEDRKKTTLTQDFLSNLKEHLEFISQPGGIFQDTQVTNMPFRGGLLQVYAILYRRKHKKVKTSRRTHVEEITRISRKFIDQMRSCGMRVKRMHGDQFYQWMKKWFNPKNELSVPLPNDEMKPTGFDLTEQLFFNTPESFEEGWLFDDMPHKVITIQNMTVNPAIGHLSAERTRNTDDKLFNLIDHLPEGSTFVITVTFQAQSEVELHLKKIENSAVGHHAQAIKVKNELEVAAKSIAHGDGLFPVVMAVYIHGETLEELHSKEEQTEVLLNSNGFKVIIDDELFPIDAYLRYLPMCYNYEFDRHHSHRSRYLFLSDISKLLPFYGRSRGTNHPGLIMHNRGGEPWCIDFYADRMKNAHVLLFGETGTGKSNLLNYLCNYELALYNSRLFILEAGGSFDIFGIYCKDHGLTVNSIKIDPKNPISLNPFAQGLRVIEQLETFQSENDRESFIVEHCDKIITEQLENSKPENVILQTQEDEEPRDILGDMVFAALLMITGGEQKEEESIRRSDRMIIVDAIIDAAYFVKSKDKDQMIASDIIEAFERLALKLDPERDKEKIKRTREMADAMSYFTKDPVSSKFFNSYGTPWPLADVTIVDFGLFASEGYEAHRAIAYAGCISKVVALAEANQNGNRPIRLVGDENHIFSSIPLLAAIQTRTAKMGRKLGLWLTLATQNLKDYADSSIRLLAQCEFWMCLALPADEINQIDRFKQLTFEQKSVFLSAQKERGKYTEGVMLTSSRCDIFRNVPPRINLAMAATEQSEKFERANIMKKYTCSVIEAVKIIAKRMMQPRFEVSTDD